jgi:hypothetical protein
MKRKLLAAAALLAGTFLAACGPGYYTASYGPPPPPRYGTMGYAPGPGYIWVDGYYNLSGGRWNWINGTWLRPPRGRSVYVRPEWRREGRSYRFHRGYWR